MLAITYALTGSRPAAEDLAQEAFVAAHRNWDRVSRYDRPELWIRRVATNLAVSRLRRRMAEAKALFRLGVLSSPGLAELPAEDAQLWHELRSLPTRQAQALVLRYVDDRPLAEIAVVLGCAEGTVKSHLYRARVTLAARLGAVVDDGEQEP